MEESRATNEEVLDRVFPASGTITQFADTEVDQGSQDFSMTWKG